jgi:tryptophanyl-tRNA synthetase
MKKNAVGGFGPARKIVLTGDRPSGNLHIGHYVGSIKKRIEMQQTGEYEMYILVADLQAMTDNADNPQKVRANIIELMLDYLAAGLDPDKVNFVLQSSVPALFELPMYYANLVTQARLERNPTVKDEIRQKKFNKSIPVGFVFYPISQAADITAFGAHFVPVGADQAPMLEQTREIAEAFNRIYGGGGQVLQIPEALISGGVQSRLVGTDGGGKMSKSIGNCIYLKDSAETLHEKVMSMYTDPNHLRVQDPGKVDGNVVFIYLNAFAEERHFAKFLSEYKNLRELESHYKQGGLGDVKIKTFLFQILDELLTPMRRRREIYEKNIPQVLEYLRKGTCAGNAKANETLTEVRAAIGINVL